jgi:transcriptional regulator with XRE-family HTH domain
MPAQNPKSSEQGYPVELMKQLGARIKVLRIAKGHSNHEKFAFEHNINRSQYWRYEQGEDLKFSTLLKIIKALDVSLLEFFSEGFDG